MESSIWAASWQNQQNDCAPSEDSDQSGHLPSMIRVLTVHSMGSYRPKLSSCGQRRLWSDWVNAQLIWVFAGRTCHFVGFVMRQLICIMTFASKPSRNLNIFLVEFFVRKKERKKKTLDYHLYIWISALLTNDETLQFEQFPNMACANNFVNPDKNK